MKEELCVIINCYGEIDFMEINIRRLCQKIDDNIHIEFLFSDSSQENIYKKNDSYLKSIFKEQNFIHLKLENKGVPFALNSAIEFSLKVFAPSLIMLLTDDAIIMGDISYNDIFEYFYKNCRPEKDALLLTYDPALIAKKEVKRSTENGLIFSPYLFYKNKFREDLIMDQFDNLFCDNIYWLGGKIFVFSYPLLTVKPIGREKNGNYNFLPPWRNYLLVRNTLILWQEKKNNLIKDVLFQNFIWSSKAIIFSKRNMKLSYLKAIYLGIIDGITRKLGVTENLNLLSDNRFR
jgi:hypothetical protein